MTNNIPSLNPADNDTLVGAFRFIGAKMMQSVNCALPARVIAFNRSTNRAQVQPMVTMLTTDGSSVPRAQIASVPVFQIGGGGFTLNFNLKSGDLGWIIACDRDISLFTQSYSEAKPNTVRTHDFADSFFLPQIMTGVTIAGEDAENVVLQSADGATKISLGPDRIKIQATTIELNGDVVITGDLQTDGDANIDGDLNTGGRLDVGLRAVVQGDIASGGNITAAGAITPGVPIPP